MAICHLRTSVGKAALHSAGAKHDYIAREGKYARDSDEVEHAESRHMPEWAGDARAYWRAADANERANGRLYVEVQVALPVELDRQQRRALALAYAEALCDGRELPYTVAIHRGESREAGKPGNPHAHIILSERGGDGHARDEAQWFRRANRKNPERGGSRKATHMQGREWPERIRGEWAAACNRALAAAGREERIDPRRLAEQAREALERGELDRAAELSRAPEPKRGAGEGIEKRREAAAGRGVPEDRLPKPSWAVRQWRELKQANAQWLAACRQRAAGTEQARDLGAELRDGEKAITGLDDAAMARWGGLNGAIARVAELQRWQETGELSQQERKTPTRWERYQRRWPDRPAEDRPIFEAITKQLEHWRRVLRERFQKLSRYGTHWEPAEPKPLPRSLAPQGRVEPGAALHAQAYAESLPERYRKQLAAAGIVRQSLAAEGSARQTWRYALASEKGKPAVLEAAARKACGPEAQQLDGAMHADRARYRGHWDVLQRHDAMRGEEITMENERKAREKRALERRVPGRRLGEQSRKAQEKKPDLGWSR